MSDFLKTPEGNIFQADHQALGSERDRIAVYLGVITGTLDNPDIKKIENSYSGNAIDAMRQACVTELILSICRFWDGHEPKPIRLARAVKAHRYQIIELRKASHPHWPEDALGLDGFEESSDGLLKEVNTLVRGQEYGRIRTYRSENLAHRITQSRDRKKFDLSENVQFSFHDLTSFAVKTIRIYDRISLLLRFHVENGEECAQIYERYTRAFFDALPNFAEVENSGIVDNLTDMNA